MCSVKIVAGGIGVCYQLCDGMNMYESIMVTDNTHTHALTHTYAHTLTPSYTPSHTRTHTREVIWGNE